MFKFNSFATTVCLMLVSCLTQAQTATTSPSTTVSPYLRSHLPNVTVESILTVDDGSVPKTGGGTTRMVGIPDGIGVIDGNDLTPAEPDYFYLLVNHELNATQGITRDHGSIGAFVSKWKVDRETHEVVEGDDLIKQVYLWNEGTQGFEASSYSFDRLCSADLPPPTALFNPASGLGSSEIIYFNGEETSGGSVFGHVVTGPDAGKSYHLHHLGYAARENVLLNPFAQDKTVVAMQDDDEDAELYFYVGTKADSGTEVEKAGLVSGRLYALAVPGKPYEMDDVIAIAVGREEHFELKLLGEPGNYPADGAETEARGLETAAPVDPSQNFESLKMGGLEDGVWDTREGFQNTFYFVTKGTTSNGLNAVTRMWRAEFEDITNPEEGGTLTMLIDGPAARLGSMDNLTFEVIDGEAKIYIQEDLGGDPRLGKIWEYDVETGELEELVAHDPARFASGGSDFLTENEESSGIVSLKDVLGEGWFASSVQVHTSTGLSNSEELVEHGQLILFDIADRGDDVQRAQLIASGDEWMARTGETDPGTDWANPDAALDSSWMMGLPTPIGYGESSGVLASDLGQPETPRPAVTYFRREFDLADPDGVVLFDLYMKVDDGAVVYLNGVEVARYNMDRATEIDNGTFASANESAERDWKQIALGCTEVPLQATGNVLAVSIHQENDASSDIRMDAELFARYASEDGGSIPATPANLTVGNATETELELSWSAVGDARFVRIERQLAGDLSWEVIAAEHPAEISPYVDTGLDSGSAYNYRVSAFNSAGASACSAPVTGETVASALVSVVEEDFESGDFGIFDVVDVAEPGTGWKINSFGFGGSTGMEGNGFGDFGPTEDWLITRDPVNLVFFRNEVLQFQGDLDFSGPPVQVLYSNDYDSTIHADPNQATWNELLSIATGSGSFESQSIDVSDVGDSAYFAFKYTSVGGAGGESVRFTMDDFKVAGDCGFDFEGGEGSNIEDDASSPWTVVNRSSDFGWLYDTYGGMQGAINNNFGSDAGGILGGIESDDWLISPEFAASDPNTLVTFDYYENFGDTLDKPLRLLVTDNYTGDPATTNWTDITPTGLNGSTADAYIPVTSAPLGVLGDKLRIAFHYTSAGNSGGTTKRIGVDSVCVAAASGPLTVEFTVTRDGATATFVPTVSGGVPPYSYSWDFGDGATSTGEAPSHDYATGSYTASLEVTDGDGMVLTESVAVNVTSFTVPAKLGTLRVATFNASMNRPSAGELAADLADGTDSQIREVAEVIQRADPDVLLINEFDHRYDEDGEFDLLATQEMIDNFRQNYLEVAQASDANGISFPYAFVAGANTGVPVEFDFNNDGDSEDPDDAYGFGEFPGQYALIILSKYPINEEAVRTFQYFLWKDMEDAFLPADPADTDGDGDTSSYYNEDELAVFRLSSKSHWDVPIEVDGQVIHLLASHPTPPVFDDGTLGVDGDVADWNGLRNHDEIRFWADYIDPNQSGYIYDDDQWLAAGPIPPTPAGGLASGERFIILGDQNADPIDGDATFNPMQLLLHNDRINTSVTPRSDGAAEQVSTGSNRDEKTASFNLRADYVLPSVTGLKIDQAFVFWPTLDDIESGLLSASDHRLVAVDLSLVSTDLFVDDDQPLYSSAMTDDDGELIPAEEARIWRLYGGGFGREPDQEGFDFYVNEVASNGKTLTNISEDFVVSEEFVGLADANTDGSVSNSEFLDHVYRNIFGRAPDEAGYNWWLESLESGANTQARVFELMLHSNEYVLRTASSLSQSAIWD